MQQPKVIGGLASLLNKALKDDKVVDVSHLEADINGVNKGAKIIPLTRLNALPNIVDGQVVQARFGLANVPDFPIISNNRRGWDLAMQILSTNYQPPDLWRSLIGKWGEHIDNPSNYDRATIIALNSNKLL